MCGQPRQAITAVHLFKLQDCSADSADQAQSALGVFLGYYVKIYAKNKLNLPKFSLPWYSDKSISISTLIGSCLHNLVCKAAVTSSG